MINETGNNQAYNGKRENETCKAPENRKKSKFDPVMSDKIVKQEIKYLHDKNISIDNCITIDIRGEKYEFNAEPLKNAKEMYQGSHAENLKKHLTTILNPESGEEKVIQSLLRAKDLLFGPDLIGDSSLNPVRREFTELALKVSINRSYLKKRNYDKYGRINVNFDKNVIENRETYYEYHEDSDDVYIQRHKIISEINDFPEQKEKNSRLSKKEERNQKFERIWNNERKEELNQKFEEEWNKERSKEQDFRS